MFTLRSTVFPRALYKSTESWPFNIDTPPNTTDTKLNPLEKERQLRVLSPLLSYVATDGKLQFHTIANLVALKTEKIIERALNTFVLIGKERVSVLSILADSANPRGHWAVVGHQAVSGLKKFAQEELTPTKLQSL